MSAAGTDDVLQLALEALADDAVATPGPWFTTSDTCLVYTDAGPKTGAQIADAFDNTLWPDEQCIVNARAIAAARTREPTLAAEVVRLRQSESSWNKEAARHEQDHQAAYEAREQLRGEVRRLEQEVAELRAPEVHWECQQRIDALEEELDRSLRDRAAASAAEMTLLKTQLEAMAIARDRACLLARAGYSTASGFGWSDDVRIDADQQIHALEIVGKEPAA